ncbi:MAG: DNA translocase FtsK [Clostridia bacterium]|nr:DNA translocase FtsK [Clostridia bacterium]
MIAAFVALTMMFVDWSPVKLLLSGVLKTYIKTEPVRTDVKKRTKKYIKKGMKPEQTEISEEEQAIKDIEDNFPNFSDEELGISGKRTVKAKKVKAKKPADGDIPEVSETETDVFSGIDSILDEALPKTPDMEQPPMPEDEDAPVFPMPTEFDNSMEPTSQADTEPPFDADDADEAHTYVDAPKRLEGMEDVSEEIEDFFERIPYTFPDISLLKGADGDGDDSASRAELRETAQKLISTLNSFNVETKLLNVSKGPTVTRYELMLGEGIKVSKVVGLANDLALRLAAPSVRIEPVPGKDAIGIEIPNKTVSMVRLKEVIDTDDFKNFDSPLAFAMGKDISGKTIIHDLAKMPHVLIAGSTGSGKSVCINTLITSIIYKADPNDVKLLMVDPKVVELGVYNGIPHLLIPVVTEPRRASGALYWAVQEMLRRYALFADNNVRNIKGYNQMLTSQGKENTLPHIVIIIDELADLMMVAPAEVEDSICRLAQMARAAGMHLVVATQRPSADVLTGLIKANVPSRIAFAVSSGIDSRIILDMVGAEKLLGKGDMLFKPIGANKPTRIQGAFVEDSEVERVVEFIKGGTEFKYDEDIIEKIDAGKPVNITDEIADPTDNDELLPRAIELAVEGGKISASHLQRRLKVGFGRAARMIDQMQERGIIGPPDGSKPREVLISKEEYLEMSMNE